MNLDDLLDTAEVAELLGLSSFRAMSTDRGRYADFHVAAVAKGRFLLWLRADVEAWAAARNG